LSDPITTPPQSEPPEAIQWWRWLVGYFAREGKVIKEAKAIFGAGALVLITASVWLTWRAASSFFEERAVVLEKTIDYQKAQIDDLRNRVQTVSPASNAGHTHLVPMFLKLYLATPESKRPYINFGTINVAPIPARGASFKGYMKVFDQALTAEEEDKAILDLKAEATVSNPKMATNEISFGEYQYMTAYNKDDSDDPKLEAVKEGKKYLYAFFVGQFTDDNQPKDEKYVMERCVVFFNSLDVNGICHGHNQTYVEKLK
jgi:hypothetical protein